MGRTIITHVGTSLFSCGAMKYENPVLTETELDNIEAQFADASEVPERTRDDVVLTLLQGLTHVWSDAFAVGKKRDPDAVAHQRRVESPSEIASLSLLKPTQDDQVVLLHSDTESGRFCGKALKEVLETISPDNGFPTFTATVCQVKGLSVADSARYSGRNQSVDLFIQSGLTNYVTKMWDEYVELEERAKSDGSQELVFNVTGGYKGTIPIARDLTILLTAYARDNGAKVQCRLCYLFLESDHLIWYDPLPVRFDVRRLPRNEIWTQARDDKGVPAIDVSDPHVQAYFQDKPGRPGRKELSALGHVVFALSNRLQLHR